MPITEATLDTFAKTLVGDEGATFPKMTGPQIFDFFNDYFGFHDQYPWNNAPTRWRHARDRIAQLLNAGRGNELFSSVLSYRHFMRFAGCAEIEARERAHTAMQELNRILRQDGYELSGTDGRYTLVPIDEDLILIGSGGFANAYLRKSNGLVVKKLNDASLLDRGIRHRFKREFEIMKGLEGVPGVLKVYDYDEETGSYTMEAGERTLKDFMETPLPERMKLTILEQIITTFAEIHSRGIVHRDISPTNIFVLKGELKVADFGLGKSLETLSSYQTTSTKAFGQVFYCSPEQFMYLRDGDKRSDVYSLGRLINFVMAGHPVNVTHKLRTVAEKATSQDPDNRYQDADELLSAFKRRVALNYDEQRLERIKNDARSGLLTEEVADWIYSMDPTELCRSIVKTGGRYTDVVSRFACSEDAHAEFVIDSIGKGMTDACRGSFDSNDPFAAIAFQIAKSRVSFDIRERACRILAYVANYVDRWNAQSLVSKLIDDGIDPMLEDVLSEHPSHPAVPEP